MKCCSVSPTCVDASTLSVAAIAAIARPATVGVLTPYRRVVEYFDAVKIGLTATPALHTAEIFGDPVYRYSYRDAVIDGWLIDHDPPHLITTALSAADGTRRRARLFSAMLSHYVIRDRYGRPGKGNDKGGVEGLVGYLQSSAHAAGSSSPLSWEPPVIRLRNLNRQTGQQGRKI